MLEWGKNKTEIKYSFIMPYHNRAAQLEKTLESFVRWYGKREDYDVQIVITETDTIKQLFNVIETYSRYMPIFFRVSEKCYYNPSIYFNAGVDSAVGKYLILTNPECKHEVDVLKGLDEEFKKNSDVYVVCGCRSEKADGSFRMWYQHSKYRNERFHFCTALSKKTYNSVGGFDERYAKGYCFDDNAFRDSLKNAGVQFILRDNLLVTHQHHEKVKPPNWRQLWNRNRQLYEEDLMHAK